MVRMANILTQILLTLVTFIALPILRKISICHRWFLLSVSYYVTFQSTLRRVINGKQYDEQNLSWNVYY